MGKEKKKLDVKRFSSALIGFPFVVLVMVLGNKYVVDIGMAIIAIIAIYEYMHAVSKIAKPVKWISYLSCLSIAVIHVIPSQYLPTIGFIAVPTLLLLLFLQVIITEMKTSFRDVAFTFLGICYAVFFSMCISLIRGLENGHILIWVAIFAAWGTDVCAYLIGCTFGLGKHKFSNVSPKKSIEGCIAGIVGATAVILIYTCVINISFSMQISYIKIALIAVILSIVGQIGDFAASAIKRDVGEKDFSNLIPGHGGMLDRIDSLLFIAPFAYVLLSLI